MSKYTKVERAEEIMGKNFVSGAAVKHCLRLNFDPFSISPSSFIPFTEDELVQYRDEYVLIPGLPLTIFEMRVMLRDYFSFSRYPWYTRERLGYEKRVSDEWFLIRKGIVPGSIDKPCGEQRSTLTEREDVPWACELIYSMIVYRSVKWRHLVQEGRAVHCKDYGPAFRGAGSHVWVASEDGDINPMIWWDCGVSDEAYKNTGTISIIRPGGREKGGVRW